MDFFLGLWVFVIGVTGGILIGVGFVHKTAVKPLNLNIRGIEESKASLSHGYGMLTGQCAPFMKAYPFDLENFFFLGEPIDGIQFEADRIIFVEFRVRGRELNEEEKLIKHLVEAKHVDWYQFYVEE